MDALKPLETSLADIFKKGPQLPPNAKKWLSNNYHWFALVGGVLQVLAAWAFWRAGHRLNELTNGFNDLYRAYGVQSDVPELGVIYWLALIVLLASGVLLLVANPALKAKQKRGWDLLFLGALVNLAYGIISLFVDASYGGGTSRLLGSVIGTAIGFWFLFQMREGFIAHKSKIVSGKK